MFKTVNNGQLPTRATKYSAGVDVYANKDTEILAGKTVLIPLGIKIDYEQLKKHDDFQRATLGGLESALIYEFSQEWFEDFLKSHFLQLNLRSSMGKNLIIPNGMGVIDFDYEDEIMLRVHNPLKTKWEVVYPNGHMLITDMARVETIKKGDRVGQLILMEHQGYLMGITSNKERSGGHGSTGK